MRRKISIIGAGNVGSQTALVAAQKQLGNVVLWNRTAEVAKGVALDITAASPAGDFDVSVTGTGNYKNTANSDVIIITAGAPRKEGQSRDDLLFSNGDIVKNITENVVKYSKNAVIIVVTNPLDAMVWLTWHVSRLSQNRVIGMAGVLDTARYRAFIAKELDVSVKDVNAMVLGGHGDSMVPLVSHSSVNGIPITKLLPSKKISAVVEHTRKAGEEIIKLENTSAFFSPAYSAVQMAEAILKDRKSVMPCAAYLKGEYGFKGIFMGVPVKLGSKGVEKIIEIDLTAKEKKDFNTSAKTVQGLVEKLKKHYR